MRWKRRTAEEHLLSSAQSAGPHLFSRLLQTLICKDSAAISSSLLVCHAMLVL